MSNLLRARERERGIWEPRQEKNELPEKPPLFATPYKVMVGEGVMEGQEERRLGQKSRAVASASGVADLSMIRAEPSSSHLLNFSSSEYVFTAPKMVQAQ